MHTYTHTHVYTRAHIHKWTHIDTRCCTHRSTLYKHTHFHMCRHIQTCIHILTHTYTHGAHTHTHTYTGCTHSHPSGAPSHPGPRSLFIVSRGRGTRAAHGRQRAARVPACRPCAPRRRQGDCGRAPLPRHSPFCVTVHGGRGRSNKACSGRLRRRGHKHTYTYTHFQVLNS